MQSNQQNLGFLIPGVLTTLGAIAIVLCLVIGDFRSTRSLVKSLPSLISR